MHTINRRRWQGITLVEAIAAMSIVGILASLAIPSFASLQRNAERSRAVNAFWHAVFLARSEAIKRNGVVALCKSVDGNHCNNTAGDWTDGWIVFHNLDHDEPAQVDDGEPILLRYGGWQQGQVTSNRSTFSFRPMAQGAVNGTILFCDSRGSREARAIIISHTGRPRVSTRDASNRPLVCPS